MLKTAGLEPINEKIIVLLDASSSMRDLYQDKDAQGFLRALSAMRWVKILRFNDGLVAGGDLDGTTAQTLTTRGGTQLGRALAEIEFLFGLPSKLLIVTDGEHDSPKEMLVRIENVRECLPKEIGKHMDWLR
jgi:hypothetical protein